MIKKQQKKNQINFKNNAKPSVIKNSLTTERKKKNLLVLSKKNRVIKRTLYKKLNKKIKNKNKLKKKRLTNSQILFNKQRKFFLTLKICLVVFC